MTIKFKKYFNIKVIKQFKYKKYLIKNHIWFIEYLILISFDLRPNKYRYITHVSYANITLIDII